MPPQDDHDPTQWNASQIVAHNMAAARELREMTQAEVADALSAATGAKWSATTVAQAEGSVAGTRIRQFTATELVALSRIFDLPITYFFMPSSDPDIGFKTADSPRGGWSWEYLLTLVWSHEDNYPLLADRAAEASSAAHRGKRPHGPLGGTTRTYTVQYSPRDALAAAMYGMARRGLRGTRLPGKEISDLAERLHELAFVLEAFNNYPPSAFLSGPALEEFERRTQQSDD